MIHFPASLQGLTLTLSISILIASCSTPSGPPPPEASSPNPANGQNTEMQSTEMQSTEIAAETEPEATTPEITLNGPGQILPTTGTAEIKGQRFDLEIAATPQQQQLGLMFRSELPDNRGMLFPFPSPRRANFWMKNVPVPLDMIFLRAGKVIFIAAQVPPCGADPCPSYGPGNQLVDTVLELRSGRAAELELAPGDTVTLSTPTAPAP